MSTNGIDGVSYPKDSTAVRHVGLKFNDSEIKIFDKEPRLEEYPVDQVDNPMALLNRLNQKPSKPPVTGPANNPEYEKARLSKLEPILTTVDGKEIKFDGSNYYMDGERITEEKYHQEENKRYADNMRQSWTPVEAEVPVPAPNLDKDPVIQDDNKLPTQPQQEENLTQEQINQRIQELKPGEEFKYQLNSSINLPGLKSKSSVPVIWKRENDGSLIQTTYEPDFSSRKLRPLETKYDSSGTKKIYEDKVTERSGILNTVERINYNDNGNPETVTMSLQNPIVSSWSKAMTILRRYCNDANDEKYTEQVVTDMNGNILVKYSKGNYYNEKGKVIDLNKAYNILSKAEQNNNLNNLIQKCKTE